MYLTNDTVGRMAELMVVKTFSLENIWLNPLATHSTRNEVIINCLTNNKTLFHKNGYRLLLGTGKFSLWSKSS